LISAAQWNAGSGCKISGIGTIYDPFSMLPVLYSFRRCPYAIRARFALHVSGTAYTLREVELRNKPAAMLAASPKGSVPVLVLPDGTVIDESFDIMRWALQQKDPDNWLGHEGCYLDEASALVASNDGHFKAALDRYKYPERNSEQCAEHAQSHYRSQGERFLQDLEARLADKDWLLGDHISIADAAVLPFVRQFAGVDRQWFDQSPYRRLRAWCESLLNSEMFVAVMQKQKV
jgi:glutathione S-transferase